MSRWFWWLMIPLLWSAVTLATGDEYRDEDGRARIAVVMNPYQGMRNLPDLSGGPAYLAAGGIESILAEMGCRLKPTATVQLTAEEQSDYGVWHRQGLANGHLAQIVAGNRKDGFFTVALVANCNSLMGILGGLQHSGPGRRPLRVGLVYVDAHGDFNTPETTLSGMLAGMPVAISAGMCLTDLRLKSGLDPALPTRYIVLGAARDLDPGEQELLDRSDVEMLSVEDLRRRSENVDRQLQRLSGLTDVIYLHVDLDVIDPSELSRLELSAPDGPTSSELAAALSVIVRYEKVAAFGITSLLYGDEDPDGSARRAAYNLIQGAVRGLQQRQQATPKP